jgi:hypothetical protein
MSTKNIEDIVYQIIRDISIFRVGIAVDYLSHPSALSDNDLTSISSNTTLSAEMIKKVPRGSVIGQDESGSSPIQIFYPFFSSHVSLPVKPGEKFWFFTSGGVHYWISRKVVDFGYEDPCLTRSSSANRAKVPSVSPSPKSGFEPNRSSDLTGVQPQSMGLQSDLSRNNLPGSLTYSQIEAESISNKDVVLEPVPVYSSLCSELTLQGSNNTVVTLGAGFDGNKDLDRGFIDISTGRGRSDSNGVVETQDAQTGKTIASREQINPSEGVVDVSTDATRILLSTRVDPDSLFGTSLPGAGSASESASIVQKADKIRVIARSDVAVSVEGSNGCSVVLNSSGDIYVNPSASGKVYLSGPESDQGYVRYDDLRSLLEQMLDILIKTGTAAVALDGSLSEPVAALTEARAGLLSSIESQKIIGS